MKGNILDLFDNPVGCLTGFSPPSLAFFRPTAYKNAFLSGSCSETGGFRTTLLSVMLAAALITACDNPFLKLPPPEPPPETPRVIRPAADPANGYDFRPEEDTIVRLSCATSGAAIYYTTDGSNPATSKTRFRYAGPIQIQEDTVIKAVAEKEGWITSALLTASYTLRELGQLIGPVLSPGNGHLFPAGGGTITFRDHPDGAAIYYTTDGTTPDRDAGTLYTPGTAITIEKNTTIKAIAVKADMIDSFVKEVKYFVKAHTPEPSEASGHQFDSSESSITLTSATDGAAIYYTVNDGDETLYDGVPISISENATIIALAKHNDYADSDPFEGTYYVRQAGTNAMPELHPGSGHTFDYPGDTLTMTQEDNVPIYYTISYTNIPPPDPTAGSTLYTGPIFIDKDTTIKAIAIGGSLSPSGIITAHYYVEQAGVISMPIFDPEDGSEFEYTGGEVSIFAEADADIYYTISTTGTEPANPTAGSTLYTGPIPITGNTIIKAVAIAGGPSSEVATATFTVKAPPSERTAMPACPLPEAGHNHTYAWNAMDTVTLSCATPGAVIWYTVDGSSPYDSPTRMQGPSFEVFRNLYTTDYTYTFKAAAKADSMAWSEILECHYTVTKCPSNSTVSGVNFIPLVYTTGPLYLSTSGNFADAKEIDPNKITDAHIKNLGNQSELHYANAVGGHPQPINVSKAANEFRFTLVLETPLSMEGFGVFSWEMYTVGGGGSYSAYNWRFIWVDENGNYVCHTSYTNEAAHPADSWGTTTVKLSDFLGWNDEEHFSEDYYLWGIQFWANDTFTTVYLDNVSLEKQDPNRTEYGPLYLPVPVPGTVGTGTPISAQAYYDEVKYTWGVPAAPVRRNIAVEISYSYGSAWNYSSTTESVNPSGTVANPGNAIRLNKPDDFVIYQFHKNYGMDGYDWDPPDWHWEKELRWDRNYPKNDLFGLPVVVSSGWSWPGEPGNNDKRGENWDGIWTAENAPVTDRNPMAWDEWTGNNTAGSLKLNGGDIRYIIFGAHWNNGGDPALYPLEIKNIHFPPKN